MQLLQSVSVGSMITTYMLQTEDMMLREQIERYNLRLREFEEKQRQYRGQQERGPDPDLEVSTRN